MLTKKPSSQSDTNSVETPNSPTSARSARPMTAPFSGEKRKDKGITRVVIKIDVGFGNSLFIRGKGANLSWEKGILLHNRKADEWVWETEAPFTACEFKVLINDCDFEAGENHPLTAGSTIQYTPRFE